MTEATTEGHLLGGRVRFTQPATGYRVAIDPVLLAAAVPAAAGEAVLDAGSGSGAASLCLAARVPECQVIGLELQRSLQRVARDNVGQNDLGHRVEMIIGDLGQPPPRLLGRAFDQVMTNPPHLAAGGGPSSPQRERALAHVEHGLGLADWLTACLRLLRSGGWLTVIHRAERLGEILATLQGPVGELVVFPLWPGLEHRPAKRVLIQGRKGAGAPLRLLRGMDLHEVDGSFTPAAEDVLRHGLPLYLHRPGGPADG